MNNSSVHPTLDMATDTINDWRDVWRPSSCNASQLPHFLILYPFSGASTQRGNGARWREFCDNNDAFARVYNNLLLHEYVYYFTPCSALLTCSCCVLCLKKTSQMFLAITRESIVGFLQYLVEKFLRKHAIKRCYIFPPHVINALHYLAKLETRKFIFFTQTFYLDLPINTQVS